MVQPETQHRARYLTEGSRGSVKDRTQQGFPTVKVFQIFFWGGGGLGGGRTQGVLPSGRGGGGSNNLVCLLGRACLGPPSLHGFPCNGKLVQGHVMFSSFEVFIHSFKGQ